MRVEEWILGTAVVGSLFAPPAEGAALRVPDDYPTISAAMTAAVSGDSVVVAPGTYTNCNGGPCGPDVAALKTGVALLAEAGPDVTTLRVDTPAGGLSAVFGSGIGSAGALLKGFTITGAATGYRGAVFLTCLGVVVEDCRFVDLMGGVQDGAGMKANGSTVLVRNSEFRRCSASGDGAGFRGLNGSSVLDGCVFDECSGGAASIEGLSGSSGLVRNCVFWSNTGNAALTVLSMPQAEISGCTFAANASPQNATAIVVGSNNGVVSLLDNLFVGNDASIFRSVVNWTCSGEIRGNVFYGNVSQPGYGTLYDHAAASTVRTIANNIFVQNTGGPAFRMTSSPPAASCNLFWSNPGGNLVGYVPSPTDLFVDPLFCDAVGGDFSLMEGSPCLPENSGTCGLIGAFSQGCGVVSLGPASWGKLKAAYR